ncbi:MAG: penicillin-binding transpeptidase domain-containing protein [bacterium]|nr:penicillin-binding transpeptidase domain-containing protein [bacterium]
MWKNISRQLFGRRVSTGTEIDPDEIFLDSSNLPEFDRHQFEGRLEKPIPARTILFAGAVVLAILLLFMGKSFALQVKKYDEYARLSEDNRLRHIIIFGERGLVYDRRGEILASNISDPAEPAFSKRKYSQRKGLAHLLGFLKYPSKDSAGFYYKVDFEGLAGAEKYLNEELTPEHGLKIIETDVHGNIASESVLKRPVDGRTITLSIDARISERMQELLQSIAEDRGFQGGAAVIMDVESGEILALSSYPEYKPQMLTDGIDSTAIRAAFADPRKPFLNRATEGLYSPGSIVKPFFAIAALEEKIITPEKEILSTGSISIQNPYDPEKKTVFRDWKAHGLVNMREAIAVSSDVYFYEVGGGFEDQKGLGIGRIDTYARLFGFGREPGGNNFFGAAGVIPTPAWKAAHFDGEPWRVGDTYNTSIGQYGFQVTPLQAVRATAAVANNGKLLEPRLIHESGDPTFELIPASLESFKVAQEGMRDSVKYGTAAGLAVPFVTIGGKTGTAELGTAKKFVNSWVTGFFPYEHPRFAFAVLLERGPRGNTVGAVYLMRQLLEWMNVYTPEYFKAAD